MLNHKSKPTAEVSTEGPSVTLQEYSNITLILLSVGVLCNVQHVKCNWHKKTITLASDEFPAALE